MHLQKLAEKYSATPGQIALNWLIHYHGETVVAIPGASKPRQAEQNAGSMNFRLEQEELELLDKISSRFKSH